MAYTLLIRMLLEGRIYPCICIVNSPFNNLYFKENAITRIV